MTIFRRAGAPFLGALRLSDFVLVGSGILVAAGTRAGGGQLDLYGASCVVVVVVVGVAGDSLGCSKHPDIPRLV